MAYIHFCLDDEHIECLKNIKDSQQKHKQTRFISITLFDKEKFA